MIECNAGEIQFFYLNRKGYASVDLVQKERL